MSEFFTQDIGLAAFLAHIGVQHFRTEKVGNRSAFVFEDEFAECRKIESDYYGGARCEDAQRLCDSYRMVLSTIRIAREHGIWRGEKQDRHWVA
jgi:hypothetical protein